MLHVKYVKIIRLIGSENIANIKSKQNERRAVQEYFYKEY